MTPSLVLDSALRELYNLNGDHADIYLITFFPTSQIQTTRGLPICTKYAYQDGLWPKDISFQALIHPSSATMVCHDCW